MWLPSPRLCLQPPSLLRGKDSSRDDNRNAVIGVRCNELMAFGAWQSYLVSQVYLLNNYLESERF